MEIAILLFDGFTALDAIGPYEVLSHLPGAGLTFIAHEPGPVSADSGMVRLHAERSLAEMPAADVILVPGGPGDVLARAGGEILEWLRVAHEDSTWTTSVCTGSLLLAAAGLLEGRRATTHWQSFEQLAELGALPTHERVVIDGKLVSAAGVSAGIDMALTLAAEIAGPEVAQAIQLGIEYDPQPPFDAGSPDKAPTAIVEMLRARSS
jgi:transcriptional regulator GlxA family with amidase domain